ncbi:MAG: OmpA family protein, partial [Flavobacterium sp.]|nr:OmpA family protein [Flavobacterium sp.]
MKSFLAFFLLLMAAFSASAQESFVVYFESNKHELNKKEMLRLESWMQQNTTSKIVAINGFTDEDGTTAYNDT